jgi:hypothetical protein
MRQMFSAELNARFERMAHECHVQGNELNGKQTLPDN